MTAIALVIAVSAGIGSAQKESDGQKHAGVVVIEPLGSVDALVGSGGDRADGAGGDRWQYIIGGDFAALPATDSGLVPGLQEGGVDGWIEGKATHYGVSYNGLPLGCGTGDYHSDNPSIVAVSPSRYVPWPCGTRFEICGGKGCILAVRHDACPGCGPNHLDLSEAGITAVCGGLGTCQITFRVKE